MESVPELPALWVVESHGTIDSTQARMRARIREGEDVHGHAVRATEQLAGGGTRGRTWSSGPGGSYQTMAVRTRDATMDRGQARPPGAPGVSVAIGIGLAMALTELADRVLVKWPNDLIMDDAKLGGILCEVFRGWLLVGVGVNVANEPPSGGTALRDRNLGDVHSAVLSGVRRGLELWTGGGSLRTPFAPVDWLAGRHVDVRTRGRIVSGVAGGVADDGGLCVDGHVVDDGSIARIGSRSTS